MGFGLYPGFGLQRALIVVGFRCHDVLGQRLRSDAPSAPVRDVSVLYGEFTG